MTSTTPNLAHDAVTFDNYQLLALRTEKRFDTPLARLEHAALGLVTETGEAAIPIKRVAIYGRTLNDLDKDGKSLRTHLAEEIGDSCWYLAIAADVLYANVFGDGLARQRYKGPTVPTIGLPGALKREVLALAKNVGTFCSGIAGHAYSELDGQHFVSVLETIGQRITNICHLADLDLLDIMAENVAKLRERFPDAYSDEAAEARADKGGLDARHS